MSLDCLQKKQSIQEIGPSYSEEILAKNPRPSCCKGILAKNPGPSCYHDILAENQGPACCEATVITTTLPWQTNETINL